jgi:hypothetical protein
MDEPSLQALSINAVRALSTIDAVHFFATGLGIQDLKVQVFNLKGNRVFQSDWQLNGWAWSLQDQQGRHVPQGVYLYRLIVRGVKGEITKIKLQKLLVTETPRQKLVVSPLQTVKTRDGIRFLLAEHRLLKDLQIQVYDLQGRELYRSGWQSSGWLWKLQDGHGQPLARSVYLYVMTVRGSDGEIAKRTVQKLIVND